MGGDTGGSKKRKLSKSSDNSTKASDLKPNKTWTDEKRSFLLTLIKTHGETGKWNEIARDFNAALGYTPKQLRDYYAKVMKPQIEAKKGKNGRDAGKDEEEEGQDDGSKEEGN